MGYTHYFERKQDPTDEQWEFIYRTAQILSEKLPAGTLCPDETEINENVIRFNGVGDDGHETFYVTRDYDGFNFCKTARKPYDLFAVVCLIAMHNHAPGVWDIASDGDPDDWELGLAFIRRFGDPSSMLPPGVAC